MLGFVLSFVLGLGSAHNLRKSEALILPLILKSTFDSDPSPNLTMHVERDTITHGLILQNLKERARVLSSARIKSELGSGFVLGFVSTSSQ